VEKTIMLNRTATTDWRDFYWYHCIDLGYGLVTEGTFDMAQHLAAYCFPQDLAGERVLDVGRGSGYFSFEFERRVAQVLRLGLCRG
jgi:hypothetical protein